MVYNSETQELVRWIKRDPGLMASIPRNVVTMKGKLNYVRNSKKGQRFLRETIQRLEEAPIQKKNWEYYLHLSGYYSAVKEFQRAFEAISEAVDLLQIDTQVIESLDLREFLSHVRKLSEEDKEVLYAFFRLKLQVDNNFLECGFEVEVEPEEVEVREITELKTKDFHGYYCQRRIPVVINGYPGPKWTEQTLTEQIGSKKVLLKRSEDYSDEWACLVPSQIVTVKEFINSSSDKEYLFDWSIPLHCPDNELVFQIPRIFLEGDVLKSTSESAMYHKSWPSLFVCKAGMSSQCHVDAFDSHFWMYLVKGKKKWTFFNPKFLANLGPIYHSSLDPSFIAANWDNIKNIPRKVVHLEPGQLLYVPHGWPHIVDNLEDSIAVSGNFVNYTNLPHALKQLKMISLSDVCFLDFLEELQQSDLAL